jgi:hypothetical protein
MGTILKNILSFTGLLVGVPVSLPHGLSVNGVPVKPQLGGIDAPGFDVVADAVNVTVTRTTATTANVGVYVEHWHTIEDVTPPGGLETLTPFFLATGGESGGGAVPQTTVASGFLDFVNDPGAMGAYFGHSGSGLAEMINAQTLVGPTGAPYSYIGACRLHVQAGGDDAFIDLSLPSGRSITDGQIGTLGPITFEVAAHVNDDETAAGNSTDVTFFGTTLGFETSNFKFGNNHWWAMGDPAFPGGFDTGVPVDVLRLHKYRTEEDPTVPVLRWLIDGVVAHQAATALVGSAFGPFLDCNVDAPSGANDVIIDYIAWTIAVAR